MNTHNTVDDLVPFSFMVPRSDLHALREIGEKARIPVSILIRQAVRDYLESTRHDVVPWLRNDDCTNDAT